MAFFGPLPTPGFTLHHAPHDGRPGFPGAGGRLPVRSRCGRVYVQFRSFAGGVPAGCTTPERGIPALNITGATCAPERRPSLARRTPRSTLPRTKRPRPCRSPRVPFRYNSSAGRNQPTSSHECACGSAAAPGSSARAACGQAPYMHRRRAWTGSGAEALWRMRGRLRPSSLAVCVAHAPLSPERHPHRRVVHRALVLVVAANPHRLARAWGDDRGQRTVETHDKGEGRGALNHTRGAPDPTHKHGGSRNGSSSGSSGGHTSRAQTRGSLSLSPSSSS